MFFEGVTIHVGMKHGCRQNKSVLKKYKGNKILTDIDLLNHVIHSIKD